MAPSRPDLDVQRLDKWLWHARFVRTRGAATALVEKARFRLDGRTGIKPAQKVRVGDVLTFPLGKRIRVIKVLAITEKRGNATLAQTLYEDLSEDQPESETQSLHERD